MTFGRRSLFLPGALLAAWALLSVPHGLTLLDLLAGVAAAGAGLMAGPLWPRLHAGARRSLAMAEDLLGEGGGVGGEADATSGRSSDLDGAAGEAPGDPAARGDHARLDARAAPDSLAAILGQLRHVLGATRLVVWRVDRAADLVEPSHAAGGTLPPAMAAAGSPLVWALEERSSLRLDVAPRWADGPVVAAPVDDTRVLTLELPLGESGTGSAPEEPALEFATGVLGAFLRLHDQQSHAVAATHRFDRMVDFLRSVPSGEDPSAAPAALARTALEIAGGVGALVASWEGEAGVVLVKEGGGGGPRPGTPFAVLEGDLAHAARTHAPVRREPGEPNRPDLASRDERWERGYASYRTVIPLVDPHGETTGLLAFWGMAPPAEQGVALLQAIAPLLALQLRQADDLEHYRARASVDPLTGLANRAALDDRMLEERARFDRYRRPVSLLVVDLDRFKAVNDTHGHEAGDAILRGVAEVIRGAIRDVDFAARFGGEELVVLLPETLLHAAAEVAERIRAAVASSPAVVEGVPIPVTASIGVSACPECAEDPDDLFVSADQALYAAKEGGRNRVVAAAVGAPSARVPRDETGAAGG